MEDYALALNAGSSSLKFCVYSRPADDGWRLATRGQIDGIGTFDPAGNHGVFWHLIGVVRGVVRSLGIAKVQNGDVAVFARDPSPPAIVLDRVEVR